MLFDLGTLAFGATSWIFDVPYGSDSLAAETDLPGAGLFLATLIWAIGALSLVVWRYHRWEP
jgi:hypothetical protein